MSINAYANAAPSVHDPADQVPSFLDDPTGCLSFIANQAVNRVFWTMLSGTAALYIKEEANGRVAALYLYAVAQQLPAADLIVGGNDDNNNNNNNIAGNYPEPDLARKQRFMEIIEVSQSLLMVVQWLFSCRTKVIIIILFFFLQTIFSMITLGGRLRRHEMHTSSCHIAIGNFAGSAISS